MSNYLHSGDVDSLSAVFRALSDPFRLKIFLYLKALSAESDFGGCVVMSTVMDDISIELCISRPHIERQLMELWRADILEIGESPDGQLVITLRESVLANTSDALKQLECEEGPR